MSSHSARFRDFTSGNEMFRVASLFLHATLMLNVGMGAYAHRVTFSNTSVMAIALLLVVFLVALTRMFGVGFLSHDRRLLIAEMTVTTIVIAILTLQRSLPSLPLPWLIGVAGVFPLALEGRVAAVAVMLLAVIVCALNIHLGVSLGEWLPRVAATLFIGLLAILLRRALDTSMSALQQAYLNERRFDAIARATRHVFVITDADYKVKYVNPAIQDVIGYTPSELLHGGIEPEIHPDDIAEYQRKMRLLRDAPKSRIFSRYRNRHKNGHWVWLEMRGINMLHDDAIAGLVFSVEDISARKDAERKLEDEHALLRAVLDLNPSMIYAKDRNGRYTISNRSFQRRYGYASEDEMRGKTSQEVLTAHARDQAEPALRDEAEHQHAQDLQVMEAGSALEDLEVQSVPEGNRRNWFRTNKYPLRDAKGAIVGMLGITRDVTDRKEYELRLEYQALHDPLTGLPNRRYLLKALADGMASMQRDKDYKLAVLFCDLDFFKSVNDTHGHDFGDKCLMELTGRILAVLPSEDFVSRFGGNEFVILAHGSLNEARRKAESILQTVSQQLVVDDVTVKIQTSIGIAALTDAHQSPSDVIRDADAALYQAKERGRNRVEIFDISLQGHTTWRAQMDVALRFALERDELAVVYQPKVSFADGSIKGFELLLRWNSPQYGRISPNDFIPIAETSGLVVPIGLWTLEEACRQLGAWQLRYQGIHGVTIGVNVSMRQLLQASFLPEVKRILEQTGVAPSSVELELTETSAMANPIQTIETLAKLKKLGLRLALDDFGTGYSSLAYLQKLPINVLKIDRAFVQGLGTNPGDVEIIRLILALAQTLHLETVAEGVENAEQVATLRQLGCHLAQGFVFSAPVSAEDAETLLRTSHRYALP